MTLKAAVDAAFGRTSYVRRREWGSGSAVTIDYRPGSESNLIWQSFGSGGYMRIPTDKDTAANDWTPCTLDRAPIEVEDQPPAILAAREDATRSIRRGDLCTVFLDDLLLKGRCTLAWAVPDQITLAVTGGSDKGWPDDGVLIPLGRLVLSANGIELPFHLLESNCWYPDDEWRLYHFVVVRSDEQPPHQANTAP